MFVEHEAIEFGARCQDDLQRALGIGRELPFLALHGREQRDMVRGRRAIQRRSFAARNAERPIRRGHDGIERLAFAELEGACRSDAERQAMDRHDLDDRVRDRIPVPVVHEAQAFVRSDLRELRVRIERPDDGLAPRLAVLRIGSLSRGRRRRRVVDAE